MLNAILGPVVLRDEQNLKPVDYIIGLPQINGGLEGKIGTSLVNLTIGASILSGLNLSFTTGEVFANIAFDISAGLYIGPISFGVDFYPSWNIPLIQIDGDSSRVQLNTTNNLLSAELTSENPAQVFGSLLFLDLGTELVDLPSPEDFAVNITNPDGTKPRPHRDLEFFDGSLSCCNSYLVKLLGV